MDKKNQYIAVVSMGRWEIGNKYIVSTYTEHGITKIKRVKTKQEAMDTATEWSGGIIEVRVNI